MELKVLCQCSPVVFFIDSTRIYSIPVACIIAHALGGNCEVVDGMINFLDVYWKEYSDAMVASGKDDKYLSRATPMPWRGSVGNCLPFGMFMLRLWFILLVPILLLCSMTSPNYSNSKPMFLFAIFSSQHL